MPHCRTAALPHCRTAATPSPWQVVFASGSGAGLTHMDFGGRAHDTYIKSHLGYGLDEARRRTLEHVVSKSSRAEKPARHPCLPKGATATVGGVSVAGEGDWAKRLGDCRHKKLLSPAP